MNLRKTFNNLKNDLKFLYNTIIMTERALIPKGYTPSQFLGDASRHFLFESKKFIEALTHPQRRVV